MDELHARGIRIAVVTNMLADIQMEKLMRLGLSERIDYLVTSEEAGIDKPHRARSLISLCANAACSRTEALMVGDNFTHDVCGAQQDRYFRYLAQLDAQGTPRERGRLLRGARFLEAADHIRTLF
ncbi:MAG: HAD family hydrolase [Butyricicoccaceae bacterium]